MELPPPFRTPSIFRPRALLLGMSMGNSALNKICCKCGEPILLGQLSHISVQTGLQGYYHWGCFTTMCREREQRAFLTAVAIQKQHCQGNNEENSIVDG